jgi:hypothetical protein
MIYVKCKKCDNMIACYKSTIHKKKYCSSECRKKDTMIKAKCLNCDKYFLTAISKYNKWGNRAKCCSEKCFRKHQEVERDKSKIRITYKCDNCSRMFVSRRAGKIYKFCSRKCSYEYQVGDKSKSYKGGTITSQGYKANKVDGKYILEHRTIMEEHIGRKLKAREQVHHLDGNKLNNCIDNLDIIDIVEHGRMHANQRWNK